MQFNCIFCKSICKAFKPFRQTFGLPPSLSGTAFEFGRLPWKGSCHAVTEGFAFSQGKAFKHFSRKMQWNCILIKVSFEPLGNRKVCTPKKTGRSQTVFRANRQNVRRQRSCSRSEFVNLLQSENALTMMRQAKSDLRSKFPDQEGSQSLRQSLKVFNVCS